MSATSTAGLTSIIVPCWNQVEFTRLCVPALFRHTRLPWELIVVDNGSTDGTGDYLAGVRDAAAVPVTIVKNARNRGFPAAINQGLELARGESLVLLNNDVVVTEGWLDQLIALGSSRIAVTERTEQAGSEGVGVPASAGPMMKTPPEGGTPADGPAPGPCGAAFGPVREVGVPASAGPMMKIPPEGGTPADGPAPGPCGAAFGPVREVGVPASAGPMMKIPPEGGTPADGPGPVPGRAAFGSVRESRGPDARSTIGLVGPMSNYATPPQLVEGVPYRDLDEMHAFARRWRDEHRGQWFTAGKLSGFCVLVKRAVFDAIGGLDERFGLGLFDDDDLAKRARRAGFALAVAHDLFVHHFGSRTFAGNGIDAEGLLEENARRFAEKWGHDRPSGRRVALPAWPGLPGFLEDVQRRFAGEVDEAAAVLPARARRTASVTLTIIARDEEKNLPHCLESVRGIFDEIVVVDTGSVDRTREVAREHGAKVFDFAWIDDFAAARNAALQHATGDYAFWLDADDVIEPAQRETLRALLEGLRPGDGAAYVVRCACDPGADGSGGETVVDHIRLFPLRPDVRWTYRVHEQILPALRRAGIPVRWTGLVVRHTGYVDVALRARKLERDTRILLEELRDRPDEPFILFNLGAIAIERKDWQGALEDLGKSLAHSAPSDSITRKLFALIARAHQMRGDSEAALRVCAEGLAIDPEDAELLFRKAVIHRHRGEPAEAESCWRRILGLTRPERFASVDMGIYGHLTRRNLAALAAERGDADEAARLWSDVLAECPGDGEARGMLGRIGRADAADVRAGTAAPGPGKPERRW